MNIHFENALHKAALSTGLTPKQALDGAIKIAMIDICEHLASDHNAQFYATGIIKRFCEPNMDNDTYHKLDVLRRHLLKAINASAPFEDVIGGFYESRFLSESRPDDLGGASDKMSEFISLIKTDSNDLPDDGSFGNYGSQSIVQTMDCLKQIFNVGGKIAFLERHLVITEADENALRVIVYQIMANCFRHDVRFSRFQAFCFDSKNGFQGMENYEVWGVSAKTGFDRQSDLMKSKAAGSSKYFIKAA